MAPRKSTKKSIVVEEPVVEEPKVEEPVVEEPAVQEPVVEEPAVVEAKPEKKPRDSVKRSAKPRAKKADLANEQELVADEIPKPAEPEAPKPAEAEAPKPAEVIPEPTKVKKQSKQKVIKNNDDVESEKPKVKHARTPSQYNIMLGEFMKKIAIESKEIPRNERMSKAQEMYREWKAQQVPVA